MNYLWVLKMETQDRNTFEIMRTCDHCLSIDKLSFKENDDYHSQETIKFSEKDQIFLHY